MGLSDVTALYSGEYLGRLRTALAQLDGNVPAEAEAAAKLIGILAREIFVYLETIDYLQPDLLRKCAAVTWPPRHCMAVQGVSLNADVFCRRVRPHHLVGGVICLTNNLKGCVAYACDHPTPRPAASCAPTWRVATSSRGRPRCGSAPPWPPPR